jgi:hypothetical protein
MKFFIFCLLLLIATSLPWVQAQIGVPGGWTPVDEPNSPEFQDLVNFALQQRYPTNNHPLEFEVLQANKQVIYSSLISSFFPYVNIISVSLFFRLSQE